MLFKIVGTCEVAGVEPGGTVDLDPDEPTTLALITAGHLAADKPAKKTKDVD